MLIQGSFLDIKGYCSQSLFQTHSSTSKLIYKDDFFICKAEEGGVAVATATDDNAADEKSNKFGGYLIFNVLDNITCRV